MEIIRSAKVPEKKFDLKGIVKKDAMQVFYKIPFPPSPTVDIVKARFKNWK